MSAYNSVLDAIGNTPLIKLRAASEATGCTILGKAEFMSPGQSVKDRAALQIITDAVELPSVMLSQSFDDVDRVDLIGQGIVLGQGHVLALSDLASTIALPTIECGYQQVRRCMLTALTRYGGGKRKPCKGKFPVDNMSILLVRLCQCALTPLLAEKREQVRTAGKSRYPLGIAKACR